MPHFMWKVGWHPQRLSASGKCNANKLRCYPQQLESFCVFAIKSAYAIKIKRLCHKKLSAYAIKKNIGTLWNFTKHLHQNPPEPHKVSAPEPSGTSPSTFSAKTLRNLTRSLHRNLPEPQGICPGTLRHLTTHLHLDPPEPHQVPALATSRTSPGTCAKTL